MQVFWGTEKNVWGLCVHFFKAVNMWKEPVRKTVLVFSITHYFEV